MMDCRDWWKLLGKRGRHPSKGVDVSRPIAGTPLISHEVHFLPQNGSKGLQKVHFTSEGSIFWSPTSTPSQKSWLLACIFHMNVRLQSQKVNPMRITRQNWLKRKSCYQRKLETSIFVLHSEAPASIATKTKKDS